MKKTIARWLASRAEHTARRIRRDLRDHNRREQTAAARADKRARGLRLYIAWSHKSYEAHRSLETTARTGLNLERTREVLVGLNFQPSR